MAYWKFLDLSLKGQGIELFGNNGGARNYTFILDAVEIVHRLMEAPLTPIHREINIACGLPSQTKVLLEILHSQATILNPRVSSSTRPLSDVEKTWADLNNLAKIIAIPEPTKLIDGVASFVSWFQEQNGIKYLEKPS
jgi:UDP-glucuronate 4-epimerase